MDSSTHTLLIIFVALTGLSVLMQLCVFIVVILALRKSTQMVTQASEELKDTVIPALQSTRELLERVAPQVATIATGLAQLTDVVHTELNGVRFSAAEIMDRVNRQTLRLDAMLSNGLDSVERAGAVVESAIALPVRQANGIVAAVKAVIDTYRTTVPRRRRVEPIATEQAIDPEI